MKNVAKRANKRNPRVDRNIEPQNPRDNYRRKDHLNLISSDDDFSSFPRKKRIEMIPRNISQEIFIDALTDDSKTVVIAVGPAGVGKSFLQVLHCIKQFQEKQVDKIVIVRPVITADGSNLGALPGNIIDKIGPYLGEVMSILKEYLGVKTVLHMLENELIEIIPIALIRGRSLRRCAVILEECQNIEDHVAKLILTRIGEGTRMYINGDINQADRGFNGLRSLIQRLEKYGKTEHFAVCYFNKDDVERHPVVAEVLRIFEEED